jgi:hypothetical protein
VGLGRKRATLAVSGGAPWIWNLIEDHRDKARQLPNFHPTSQPHHALSPAL